MIKFNCIL